MQLPGLIETFNDFVWRQDIHTLPAWKAGLVKLLRVFYASTRDLMDGLPSLRAMGLVYTTLLSIVPLLAVSFSVLKGFGVHNQLEPALLNLLSPLGEKSVQIVEQITGFVDNMKVGALGALGLLMLLFTVLSLVKKIESAFNFTWKISSTRSIAQRFSNYLSVIMVGPVLIFSAIGITAAVNNSTAVNDILAIEPFGSLILLVGKFIPFVLTIAAFTFIYVLVPNTKVRIKSAFTGAVTAGLLWEVTSWVFTAFIANSTNYTAIYSSFAILIIFMLWIYASWLILLTGASIAFYHQHPERTRNRQRVLRLSCRLREKLALSIVQITGYHFHHNLPPHTALSLARALDISEQAITLVTAALVEADILIRVEGKHGAFVPAHSLENTSVYAVLDAVRKAEESPSLHPDEIQADPKVDDLVRQIDAVLAGQLNQTTIKDLM